MPRGWNIAAIKPLSQTLFDEFLKSVFLQEVLPLCDLQSIGRLICVSKRLKSIVDDENLWYQRLRQHWGATDSDIEPIKKKFVGKYLELRILQKGTYIKENEGKPLTFEPQIDVAAMAHLNDYLTPEEVPLVHRIIALYKEGVPGVTNGNGQELGVFEIFIPQRDSTHFVYINNRRTDMDSYEYHCFDYKRHTASTLQELYNKIYQESNQYSIAPPAYWLKLGLWTVSDWKAWTLKSVVWEQSYQTMIALRKRYKPITIQVVYKNPKRPENVLIKYFEIHDVLSDCCKAFHIGYKRVAGSKLYDENVEVKDPKELAEDRWYTLVVPEDPNANHLKNQRGKNRDNKGKY